MKLNIKTLIIAAIAALTAFAPRAGAANYGFDTPLPEDGLLSQDYLLGSAVTVSTGGDLEAFGVDFRAGGYNANVGLYAADGAFGAPGTLIAQTGAFAVPGAGVIETVPTAPVTIAAGNYWIMAVYDALASVGQESGAFEYQFIPLAFTGSLPATLGTPDSQSFARFNYYIKVATVSNTIVYQKGDAVPGVAGAMFTSFGPPAINDAGAVAFLGKWSGGAGIFVGGALLAKVGDVITGTSALKSMKDPVIDDAGHVAFPCVLMGSGIGPANDAAIVSNAPGGTLAIVAQEGKHAGSAPAGANWKSFTSTAAPGGGGGVIILGFLAQGTGGITATNDNVVICADSAGVQSIVLQEGTTVIGGKTVNSFAVLKAVSGTSGQTHAHNTNGELVSKVTFTDGFQAVVHSDLP